jgi:hypothetical protein
MSADSEIAWHLEQIAQAREQLSSLIGGGVTIGACLPFTDETLTIISIIERRIRDSEAIVAAYEKRSPSAP